METSEIPASPPTHNPLQPVHELLQGGDPDAICARYGLDRSELDRRVAQYQESRRQAALEDHLIFRKVNRNEPCPCGSGNKYKKCCLSKHEEARRNIPQDRLRDMEEREKKKENLSKEIEKGFDLLFSGKFDKARALAERVLADHPEDDRIHDILVTVLLASGEYDDAFQHARQRWQVAEEEKAFFQENGCHKREGADQENLVYFYSPSTWLEKFWIAQRARAYRAKFPRDGASPLAALAEKLSAANDMKRFPGREEEGFEARKKALAPVLEELHAAGPAAIPYLLPLTYHFSWASLFVPDLLRGWGSDECILLLAELSMFRFPYFAQKCLAGLEAMGEPAIAHIEAVLKDNPVFDEMKVGLIAVLGNIHTPASFAILAGLTDHENPYVVNWTAQALARHQNPEALPYLAKARERLGSLSKIAGAIKEIEGIVGV